MRRKHSGLTLRDAMQLRQVESFTRWTLNPPPLPPSEHLLEDMRRFEAFDLENSEAAKLLLLDALFAPCSDCVVVCFSDKHGISVENCEALFA